MEERFKTFTLLITNIYRSIRKIKAQQMAKFNLKSRHVSCLYYLYKEKGLTAKELCDVCEEDKANVSRSIDYLEENGYLVCDGKKQKKYKTPIELTEKGYDTAKQIAEKIDAVLAQVSFGVSEEERLIMYRSLSVIGENLRKIQSGQDESDE